MLVMVALRGTFTKAICVETGTLVLSVFQVENWEVRLTELC